MTPREQLIQEVLQAPDFLVDILLKLTQTFHSTPPPPELKKLVETMTEISPSTQPLSALELAGDLVGCLEAPEDLSTNPDYLQEFGQ
jgi:hypothetical protein